VEDEAEVEAEGRSREIYWKRKETFSGSSTVSSAGERFSPGISRMDHCVLCIEIMASISIMAFNGYTS